MRGLLRNGLIVLERKVGSDMAFSVLGHNDDDLSILMRIN
jgi:hypothetical protein